jgi:hypothetical protein
MTLLFAHKKALKPAWVGIFVGLETIAIGKHFMDVVAARPTRYFKFKSPAFLMKVGFFLVAWRGLA